MLGVHLGTRFGNQFRLVMAARPGTDSRLAADSGTERRSLSLAVTRRD
jgi:hypothetical protein